MIRKILLIGLLLVGSGAATASDNIAPETAPEATPTPDIPPDSDPGVILKEFPPGGPVNQVRLVNKKDQGFLARSAISLHRSNTPNVRPKNIAVAEGQCTDCATLAIAVQVFLYQRGSDTSSIQPQNIAIAVNNGCTRCITIAHAFQYVVPVDDVGGPVPENIRNLLRDMERELKYFATVKTLAELDPYEASARLTTFARQTGLNGELVQYLSELKDQKSDAPPRIAPSESPSPSPSASASGTEAPASPTAEPAPSESPSASPAPTTTP
jgi:hypothetical protein